MENVVKLYSLSLRETKTYLFAAVFIAGNVIVPQVIHLVPGGGLVWLPIYFFTLIAAYKFGLKAGLLTAVLSPLINSYFFGMPPVAALPAILIKSTLLAFAASYAARRAGTISIIAIALAVLAYQVVGTTIEWAMVGNFFIAVQDFRIGIPGMLLQIFGGYLVLRAIAKI